MNHLVEAICALKTAGEALVNASEEFTMHFAELEKVKEDVVEEIPEVSLEEVRKVLAEKASGGNAESVRNCIESFGVKKLSEIPEEKYSELLKMAENLS